MGDRFVRRPLRILAAALALTAGLAAGPLAGSVSAQQYPPRANACRVSVTSVRPGVRVVLTCGGFRPRSVVLVRLFSDPVRLGEFPVGDDGELLANVVIPESTPAGDHTLRATGFDAGNLALERSVAISVRGDGVGGGGSAARPGGELSRTGSSSAMPLTATAVVLIGGGAGAMVVERRRRVAD